jgi:hypothetical protein
MHFASRADCHRGNSATISHHALDSDNAVNWVDDMPPAGICGKSLYMCLRYLCKETPPTAHLVRDPLVIA